LFNKHTNTINNKKVVFMNNTIRAYAAQSAGGRLERYDFDAGELKPDQVEIDVAYCGICHSDLMMLHNQIGFTVYPFVPGHEVVGKVARVGDRVTTRKVGDVVGLGWYSESCMNCMQCVGGDHNLCATAEQTIVHRHGGFADKVRAHHAWTTPLPASGLDLAKVGPLFCGGLTVFNPIVQFDVRPTDRVGVIGIGGLGHLALQFLNKWGCHVTAFTSSDSKRQEAIQLGAHDTVNSRDAASMKKLAGSLDFVLSTVNVTLDWNAILETIAPKGRLHTVGIVTEPIAVSALPLIMGQRSVSGSPLGSPTTTAKMVDFCARHHIQPVTEEFPMSQINEAFAHLESGKARYRIVLKNDL
jgi:alcohol/geraniol dehydrogenase (NADP+)